MAKEENSKPGGLLSKMVRFVRHPTVNWSDLDGLYDEQESQYSKQALKEMIERKRRNDFVRKREFEQLRRLRQAEQQQAARPAAAAPGPVAAGTHFLSSLLSPRASGERAVTLKKIDEIEAQMSQQWWRGKQAADAATMPLSLPAEGNPMPPSFRKPPASSRIPTLSDALPPAIASAADAMGFAPTQPLGASQLDLPASSVPASGAASPPDLSSAPLTDQRLMAPALHSLQSSTDFLPAFAATEVSAPQPANMVPPSFAVFEHDPDLEEPAILFANGDVDGAEQGLLGLIERREVPAQLPVWLALLDLYRAAGRADMFDKAGYEFAARFGRSAPQWFAMPLQQAAAATAAPPSESAARGLRWSAPAQLTAQSVTALQSLRAKGAGPLTLDWAAVAGIDADVAARLESLLEQWADAPGSFVLLHADRLQLLLASLSPSGDRSVDTLWWRLRMTLLRWLNQQDEFELVALDYCVTYEVSPPSWADPACQCLADAGDADAPGAAVQASPAAAPPGDAAACFALSGTLEGDAGACLESVQEKASLGEPVVIDCSQLVRMDFTAAGSLLNWAAHMQSLGHVLQFSQLHQLVAVFFNVIGIQEHAQVTPRKD
ncbi:STAS domain-containing protein [Delftia sp. PS-11]|uniref:STAS domain-containing protein n=1 Tax=Delftia sp. PS-11 TaxID=2767222 RepID=UPI0024579899|nr:STAS domain-containing protein [Delftia sp. PS-11]KAJ8746319.1 STAS domain-containing protein [Delftia sp. PS-11]